MPISTCHPPLRVAVASRDLRRRGGVVGTLRTLLPLLEAEVHHVCIGRGLRPTLRDLAAPLRDPGAVRRAEGDVLLLNTSLRSRALLRDLTLLRAWGERPALVWIHGWDARIARRLGAVLPAVAATFPRAQVAVLAEGFRRTFVAAGWPASRIEVVPPAWDPAVTGGLRSATRRGLLFMGRLVRAKGVYAVLEAFEALAPAHPELDLVFAGEGPATRRLRARARASGLDGRVRFAGWVEGQAKADAFADADVLVLPSDSEGLPVAVLEAQACGLPVVATPVGALPEIVEPDGLADVRGLGPAVAKALARGRGPGGARAYAVEAVAPRLASALRRVCSGGEVPCAP